MHVPVTMCHCEKTNTVRLQEPPASQRGNTQKAKMGQKSGRDCSSSHLIAFNIYPADIFCPFWYICGEMYEKRVLISH